jgi:pimeloyl-ACP methyl ester carboxylesterase
MFMLDVIDEGEESESHPHPIVFVHGAWHAGWCWKENFVGFFVERGFRVLAPSLRGHGQSTTTGPLKRCSISDYVSDVSLIVDTLASPPILVGHSMGGFVVQKYLETHDAPGAILMASTPPRGQLRSLMRSMRRHPWRSTKYSLTGNPSDLYGPSVGARELFFGDKASDSLIETFAMRLQPESTRAVMYDTVIGDLVDTQRINTPMLVLGGELDQIYTPDDVRRTASAYDTEPLVLPRVGHELMLEPDWRIAAGNVESWLISRGL